MAIKRIQSVQGGGTSAPSPAGDPNFARAVKMAKLRQTAPSTLLARYRQGNAGVADLYEYAQVMWNAEVDDLSPNQVVKLFEEGTETAPVVESPVDTATEEVIEEAISGEEIPIQEQGIIPDIDTDAVNTLSDTDLDRLINRLPEETLNEVVSVLAEAVEEVAPIEEKVVEAQSIKPLKEWAQLFNQDYMAEADPESVMTEEEAKKKFTGPVRTTTTPAPKSVGNAPASSSGLYADKMEKDAKIVKDKDEYCVEAESGRNMGCYNSKEKAVKRLQDIEGHKQKDAKQKVVVGYIDNEEDPRYLVSVDGIPTLAISLKQAFPDKPKESAELFRSDEYGKQLKKTINKIGVQALYETSFGSGKFATLLIKADEKDQCTCPDCGYKKTKVEGRYCGMCPKCNTQMTTSATKQGACEHEGWRVYKEPPTSVTKFCPTCQRETNHVILQRGTEKALRCKECGNIINKTKQGQVPVAPVAPAAPAAPVQQEQPALITPEVQEDLEKEPQEFSGVIDTIVDVAATLIAHIEDLTAEGVIDELASIFSDEEAKNQFAGRLKETVDQKGEDKPKEVVVEQPAPAAPVAPAQPPTVQMAKKKKAQAEEIKDEKPEKKEEPAVEEEKDNVSQEDAKKEQIKNLVADLKNQVANGETDKVKLEEKIACLIRAPRVKRVATKMAELDLGDKKELFKKLLVLADKDFLAKEKDINKVHSNLADRNKEDKKEVTGSLMPVIPAQVRTDKGGKRGLFNWNSPPKF
jgi:hypothetical protein